MKLARTSSKLFFVWLLCITMAVFRRSDVQTLKHDFLYSCTMHALSP